MGGRSRYEIAYGVWPDMTEHGWERDDWPEILKKVIDSDILVIGSAIWLGEKTSVCPAHPNRSTQARL